jgi:glycosyltransferase involved in cell wall biosynthesis
MIEQGKEPLFSLLICAYNVEKFMRNGLDSVLSMSGDFEVIVCDDGSTDSTGQIADEYAAKYENLRVVHQSNTGLGGARNTAMDVARGNYIGFYDVDDVIPGNYVTVVQSLLEAHNGVDVIVFGYHEINKFYGANASFIFEPAFYRSNNEIRDAYVEHLSGIRFNNGFTWNKLYRRDFLTKHHLRFGNQRIQQDEVFNCKVYRVADTLRTIPDVLYDYYIYNSGNTRSRFIPDRLEIYRSVRDALTALKNYWQLDSPALTEYIQKRFFRSVLDYLDFNLHHPQAGLTVAERCKAIEEVMQADDVICCIDYLLAHTQLSPREHRYAMSLLQRDVRGYEHLRKYDRAKSLLKIYIRTLLNRIHS